MAWSWSHTAEAYEDARLNLHDEPLETLQVIYAEWHATYGGEYDNFFNEKKYEKVLAEVKKRKIEAEFLADAIWDKASEQQTCDNGGYNAWVCPFGCHTVSFSREGRDDD